MISKVASGDNFEYSIAFTHVDQKTELTDMVVAGNVTLAANGLPVIEIDGNQAGLNADDLPQYTCKCICGLDTSQNQNVDLTPGLSCDYCSATYCSQTLSIPETEDDPAQLWCAIGGQTSECELSSAQSLVVSFVVMALAAVFAF